MTNTRKRPQKQKANRHVARVQELRRSNAAQPHKVYSEDRSIRKYGIRAMLKSED
jgi:hypothetical protein